jgi:hypothetical protein
LKDGYTVNGKVNETVMLAVGRETLRAFRLRWWVGSVAWACPTRNLSRTESGPGDPHTSDISGLRSGEGDAESRYRGRYMRANLCVQNVTCIPPTFLTPDNTVSSLPKDTRIARLTRTRIQNLRRRVPTQFLLPSI